MVNELERDASALRSRIVEILADVIQQDIPGATDDVRQSETDAWDSFNHIRLIIELEEAFGVQITDGEAVELHSLSAIQALMQRKAAEQEQGA